jgi:hypothetical protein
MQLYVYTFPLSIHSAIVNTDVFKIPVSILLDKHSGLLVPMGVPVLIF